MKPSLRITARLTLVGALLALAACAAVSSYSGDAPANGWNIAGIWVLNPTLSTDTHKALADLAPKPRKRGRGDGGPCGPGGGAAPATPAAGPAAASSAPASSSAPAAAAGGPGGPGGPCLAGGPGGPDDGNDPDLDPSGGPDQGQGPGGGGGGGRRGGGGYGGGSAMGMGYAGQRPAWHPPLDLQTAALAAGEWLQLSHRDDELVIANANGSRSYSPGVHSVVSVDTGVADQSSGWKGRGYTIEIKPQIGPRSVEHYELSPDGRQLIVHIDFDGEGPNKALKVVRVYDRATAIPKNTPLSP